MVTNVGRVRCISSQIIACMAISLLLLDLGMAFSFATIALPDLLDSMSRDLSLTHDQASWFGSIIYLAQPAGALLSGPIVDYVGRKKAMFLFNIPHLLSWILIYVSWNVPVLFAAHGLLGFSNGLLEAVNSYVGEVTEPSVRGAVFTITQLFPSIGMFMMYFLGMMVTWRQAALISISIPIASMLWIVLQLSPESPIWLLVQHRDQEAMKSLKFLRGWTHQEQVQKEFNALSQYSTELKQCALCVQTENGDEKKQECVHKNDNLFKRILLNLRYVMLVKETLRPFSFLLCYFIILVMSGFAPIRPNLVNVCDAFGVARGGKEAVVMVGIITFLSKIIVVATISYLGKRKLGISAMLGTAVIAAALSIFAKMELSDSVSSYNINTFPAVKSYVPLVFVYLLSLFSGFAMPWVLIGEIFPFRSRATAQGVAAAMNYVVTFLAAKTYIDLEMGLHLWGAFLVYAVFGLVGTVYLYFYLPETEGKTLQEIENYYNGNSRIFANDPFINQFRKTKERTEF